MMPKLSGCRKAAATMTKITSVKDREEQNDICGLKKRILYLH
jgi:hypothetical protein